MVKVKTAPKIKSLDEMARSTFNMMKGQAQNQKKLQDGDLTEDDIWGMAYKKAEENRLKLISQGAVDEKGNQELLDRVAKFRRDQERKYRATFEWNTSNDEATLNHILDIEANIYEIRLLLEPGSSKSGVERQKLVTQHAALTDKHKDLLAAAGIDRLTREKKKATNEPFEDWIRIKRMGDEKMNALKQEFTDAARASKDEFELRNAIKYHFGYEFPIVDTILLQHRRVLGLPVILEGEKGAK